MLVQNLDIKNGRVIARFKDENKQKKEVTKDKEVTDSKLVDNMKDDEGFEKDEDKVIKLKKNRDSARKMGYDTEPYDKEIEKLENEKFKLNIKSLLL